MRKLTHLFLLVLLCALSAITPARAQKTFTVTSLADDGSVGTLRVAMNDANAKPGSTIKFAVSGTITIAGTLPEITASMTIQGSAGSPITIDGDGNYQVFLLYAPNGTVTISNLTIQNGYTSGGDGVNGAGHGGGMWAGGASVLIRNCTFLDNYAAFGGGLSCAGNVVIDGCTFTGNTSSSWGSGGLETYGTVTMTNCTVTGNSCSGSPGGGAVMIAGSTNMINCTITGNSGPTGGIWCYQGTATLTNCILYGDSSEIGYYSGSLNASYCDIQGGYAGAANFDADPMLGPLASNGGPTQTMALLAGSPCYGAGTADGAPLTDQRGYTRPNPPSIGAYDNPFPVIASFTPTSGPVGTKVKITGKFFTDVTGVFFYGTSATFKIISDKQIIATVPKGATSGLISMTALGGTATSATNFDVTTATTVATLVLSPTTVTGGVENSTGFVTLSAPASTGGASVTLSLPSPDTKIVTVPDTVTVPAGEETMWFPITTYSVTSAKTVVFTATYGGASATAKLTVKPVIIGTLVIIPNPVTGGDNAIGLITLSSAPTEDTTVMLTSSNTNVASVPASVVIGAGTTTATFNINTYAVTKATTVTITATIDGKKIPPCKLKVNP